MVVMGVNMFNECKHQTQVYVQRCNDNFLVSHFGRVIDVKLLMCMYDLYKVAWFSIGMA